MVDQEQLSPRCRRDDHELCAHQWGGRLSPTDWRRGEVNTMLCACGCHHTCPLTLEAVVAEVSGRGQRTVVPQEAWHAKCTCLGAVAQRQRVQRSRQAGQGQKARWAAAGREIDLATASTRQDVRNELERAAATQQLRLNRHVLDYAVKLAMITRGPRLLVSPRLVLLQARGLLQLLRALARLLRRRG